jgi:transposase
VLEGLRQFLAGQQSTLLCDGLPAHRCHAMRAWLRRQRSWLVMEPLPAYAPELNAVEPPWASVKDVDLANLAGESLDDVIATAERGIHRIRHTTICPSRAGATRPVLW